MTTRATAGALVARFPLVRELATRASEEERMRALRNFVAEWNVYRWAGRMLVDAARLRDSDRLAGRLGIEHRDRPSARQPRRPRLVRLRG